MPKLSNNTIEEGTTPSLHEVYQQAFEQGTVHIAMPVLITAVGRKVNTGNYENVDVLVGVSVPMAAIPEDSEAFYAAVTKAAEVGFKAASKETGERYQLLKDLQGGGR